MKCENGICVINDLPFVCIEGLDVRYGKKVAIQNVNLTADACSITALIGPSGCGKTSFLNTLNRLTDSISGCSVSGNIRIGDIDVLHPKTNVLQLRRRVGMIFQKPNPFPLSIWKNLDLTLKQHGYRSQQDRAEKIEVALRVVGLWEEVKDRLNSSAMVLSGGQAQRLCIARAMILEPEIILFDEPCSSLDPNAMGIVEELIRSLRHKFTVLIVTHNLAQARRIADTTAVFWAKNGIGTLVEYGPTERIFAAPQSQITAAYISGQHG